MASIKDVPAEFRYLCVKNGTEGNPIKIWGVYCTFYRYDWDHDHRYLQIDDAFIFSGPVMGPFRYTFGTVKNRLVQYRRRKVDRENYRILKLEDFTNDPVYDKVRELVSKKMLWKILLS